MDQVNYEKLLPMQPTPEQVRWCFDHWTPEEFIIYRNGWYYDPLEQRRKNGVECCCTACGSKTIWSKYLAGGRSAPFGVILDKQLVTDGQEAVCPECGAKVTMRHIGQIRDRINQYTWVMSVDRLNDRLVLLGWILQRDVMKDGSIATSVKPYEAYVVEQRKLVRLTAWVRCMSAFHLTEKWEQRKQCWDSWGETDMFLPWDPAILEGSTAENSKLDLFMALPGEKWPVSWLRLWKKHQNAENLLMQGAGPYLWDRINDVMSSNYFGGIKGVPKLEEIDWKQRRPSLMLDMNKDEFRWFCLQKWSYQEYKLYLKFRNVERVRLPEDMELFRNSLPWYVNRLIEEGHPVRRSIRYCVKQGESVDFLLDYWRMARAEGQDLADDSLRWPKDLRRQHDKVMKLQLERKTKEELDRRRREMEERREGFRQNVEKIAWTAFSAGGILIRPCRDEEELVREGKWLSHCVGGYAGRIASGHTSILLIRREEKPDEPWFTLELDPKTLIVLQNRGKKNRDPTPEVDTFVDLWRKTILMKKESET